MDEELRKLFEAWKVHQRYVDRLEEEEVYTVETLLLLSDNMVKQIFDKCGAQASFFKNLQQLHKDIEDCSLTVDTLTNVAIEIICEEYLKLPRLLLDLQKPSDEQPTASSRPLTDSNSNEVHQFCVAEDGMLVEVDASKESDSVVVQENQLEESSERVTVQCRNDVPNEPSRSLSDVPKSSVSFPVPARKRTSFDSASKVIDLKHCKPKGERLCESHVDGRVVLSHYAQGSKLNDSHRNMIADLYLNEYLKDDFDKKLPPNVEEDIADQIVSRFPSEHKEVWCGSTAFKRDKAVGRGKILSRYYNKRRGFQRAKLLSSKQHGPGSDLTERVNNPAAEDDPGVADALLWLNNNKNPWAKVIEYWKTTSATRLRSFLQGTQSVDAYMSAYPALKDKAGYILLESDFETLYPDCNMNFYIEWPSLAAFIEKRVSAKVLEEMESGFTPEGKKIRTMHAVPHLFSVITVAKKGKKSFRPSREEVAEALLLHVRVESDINANLSTRLNDKYKPFDIALGPQAIVVGDSLDSITKSFVRVNGVLFPVENPLKAVDITFKVMHALDCKYHKESEREWLFLERAVYGIKKGKPGIDGATSRLISEYDGFKKGS